MHSSVSSWHGSHPSCRCSGVVRSWFQTMKDYFWKSHSNKVHMNPRALSSISHAPGRWAVQNWTSTFLTLIFMVSPMQQQFRLSSVLENELPSFSQSPFEVQLPPVLSLVETNQTISMTHTDAAIFDKVHLVKHLREKYHICFRAHAIACHSLSGWHVSCDAVLNQDLFIFANCCNMFNRCLHVHSLCFRMSVSNGVQCCQRSWHLNL